MDHMPFTKVRSTSRAFAKGQSGVSGAFNKTQPATRHVNTKSSTSTAKETMR